MKQPKYNIGDEVDYTINGFLQGVAATTSVKATIYSIIANTYYDTTTATRTLTNDYAYGIIYGERAETVKEEELHG